LSTQGIDAGHETVHWVFRRGRLKPLITVASGDSHDLESVEEWPTRCRSAARVPQALAAINKSVQQEICPATSARPVDA